MTTHLHRMARYWRSCTELFLGIALVSFVVIAFLRWAWAPHFNSRFDAEWLLLLATALAIAAVFALGRAYLLAQGKWPFSPRSLEKRDTPSGALVVMLVVWAVLSGLVVAFLAPLIIEPIHLAPFELTPPEPGSMQLSREQSIAENNAETLWHWRQAFLGNALIWAVLTSVAWGVWRWRNRAAPDPAHFLRSIALWAVIAIAFARAMFSPPSELRTSVEDFFFPDWHARQVAETGFYQLDGSTPIDHVVGATGYLALALLAWAAWRRA